jgi:branched-subunit amino acid ABC-type transport system permease component
VNLLLLGLEVPSGLLALGLITGMSYGIMAVGLVLVYRSSGVINFAHGEIGAFGAAVVGALVIQWDVPYWLAFVGGVATSAAAGGLTEVAVVRRLRKAPRLMSLVATLGVAQFLLAFSAVVNGTAQSGSVFPQPAFLPEFRSACCW